VLTIVEEKVVRRIAATRNQGEVAAFAYLMVGKDVKLKSVKQLQEAQKVFGYHIWAVFRSEILAQSKRIPKRNLVPTCDIA